MRGPRWLSEPSLLPKFIVALILALTVGGVVGFHIEARFTRAAVHDQAMETLQSDLDVLETRFHERQTELATQLRSATRSLEVKDALRDGDRARLVTLLGAISRNLRLEMLSVTDRNGDVVASVGRTAVEPPAELARNPARAPASGLVPARDGRVANVAFVPVGTGDDAVLVTGGFLFDGSAALQDRSLVGHDTILVADDRLAGSTLPQITEPPAAGVRSLGGTLRFIAYRDVADGRAGTLSGRIGVALPDPTVPLNRSLARTRAMAASLLLGAVLLIAWLLFRRLIRPLNELAVTARRIAAGDLDASFAADSRDEIGTLAWSLERMRLAVREHLGVIAAQTVALRDNSRRVVEAQDEERRRLARDLHDGIQQQLVMLRLRIGMEMDTLEDKELRSEAEDFVQELDGIIHSVRETSRGIYPSILHDRGLIGGLRSLAGRSTVPIHLDIEPDPFPHLGRPLEAHAYFFVAEAVTNALKHADASRIDVQVRVPDDRLHVVVADDGRGIDTAALARDGGLGRIRDRVTAIGGTIRVGGAPAGTRIEAVFPLAASLEVEEDGRDPAVQPLVLQPELVEDGVGVLLDRPLGDEELLGDGRVPLA